MAFDAFLYTKSHKSDIPGETQDDEMSKLGAIELLSFELGMENNINIGSIPAVAVPARRLSRNSPSPRRRTPQPAGFVIPWSRAHISTTCSSNFAGHRVIPPNRVARS